MAIVSKAPNLSLSARTVIAAAAILACVPMRLPAGSFAWTSQGPWGGSISALATAPSDPDTTYAGTWAGPAFRSPDGGLTWTRMTDLGVRAYALSLAVDPADPLVVYAGGSPGISKSTDGGELWSVVLPSTLGGGFALAVDPANHQRVYASVRVFGPAELLYRSDDAGATWTDVTGALANLGILAIAIEQDETVYAATSVGVFQSSDLGRTWNPRSNGLTSSYVQALVLDPADSAILYAGTDSGGVFKSLDHAASWSPVNSGLPDLNVHELLTVQTAVFAAVGNSTIVQSNDGGASWIPTGPGLPDRVLANAFAASSDGEVFAGTSEGVFRSSNSGSDWQEVDTGLSANTTFALAVSPASGRLFDGATTGFFFSLDEGQSWNEPANSGLGSVPIRTVFGIAVDPTDDATVYAAVDPCCGLYKTTSGGESWTFTGLAGLFLRDLAVDPSDPQKIYALNELIGVEKSADGGTSWALMNSGIPPGVAFSALAMDPSSSTVLYTATQPGGASPELTSAVYKSTDGAESWNPASTGVDGQTLYAIAVSPSDSPTVYAGGLNGAFVTHDGGTVWTPAGPGLPAAAVYSIAVDPSDASRVYVGTAAYGVYRSRDGGASWHPLNSGLTDPTIYTLKTNPDGSVLYAGTPSGVFDYRLSFQDVPASDPFHNAIETIALNGVTSGCGSGNYCPDSALTRAQSAVFLLRALHGGDFQPPPATGGVFGDVPSDGFAAAWIEELFFGGITSGCGGGNFCPDAALTRAEAAVYLLRAKHGPTYAPPPATGGVFGDVPIGAFAADWIEELALEGITSGCGGGNYCPAAPTTRGQAAAFLVRAFGLN